MPFSLIWTTWNLAKKYNGISSSLFSGFSQQCKLALSVSRFRPQHLLVIRGILNFLQQFFSSDCKTKQNNTKTKPTAFIIVGKFYVLFGCMQVQLAEDPEENIF